MPAADYLATLRARLRPDPTRPARVWMRRQWASLLALALTLAAITAGDAWVATCGFQGCPSAADIRAYRPTEGGRILDRRGTAMGRLRLVRRVNVPITAVPLHVRQAFIAVEDRRFEHHDGVDWRGAARAVAANVRAMGVRQGFSTITMQVVRNTFAVERQGERSVQRKLIELRLSRLIERALTKQQILELYLNVIYLGNGAYGVEAASRDLFGRSVKDVSVGQAAMLAALPKGRPRTRRAAPPSARCGGATSSSRSWRGRASSTPIRRAAPSASGSSSARTDGAPTRRPTRTRSTSCATSSTRSARRATSSRATSR